MWRRLNCTAIAARPAEDLIRFRLRLAAFLHPLCPRRIRGHNRSLLAIPEECLPRAVTLHRHRRGGNSHRAEIRRTERTLPPCPHTIEEVLPESFGVVSRRFHAFERRRFERLLQTRRETGAARGVVLEELESALHKFDRTRTPANHFFHRVAAQRRG